MKNIIIVIGILITSSAYSEEIQRDASRNNSGVRNEYDDLMKSSGRWEFLSEGFFTLGLLSGATSLYCYQRGQPYRDAAKQHTLNLHDQTELKRWQDVTDATGYGGVALIGLGLGSMVMEVNYENRAHSFALDMKVNF